MAEQRHWLAAAARRRPILAALVLPALLLLYIIALVPFTPSIGDLRKAKSELPSVLLALDGTVLAEYRRLNREWVTLANIAPSVVDVNVQPGSVVGDVSQIDVRFSLPVAPESLTPNAFHLWFSPDADFFDGNDVLIADADGSIDWDPTTLTATVDAALTEVVNFDRRRRLVERMRRNGGIGPSDGERRRLRTP